MMITLHPSRAGTSCKRITTIFLALGSWLFVLLPVTAQLNLVKDINTTPAGSALSDEDYSQLTPVNGKLYFVVKGKELWRSNTNGLQAEILRSFDQISNLTNVNGRLFFTADAGSTGLELWKSEGTVESTMLVKDIWPGGTGSLPADLTNVNGEVFFSAHDGSTGRELWKSNGTRTGTRRVKDIMRVKGSSYPEHLVSMNGLLFFTANDGQTGYELWKSDGSAAGTVIVKDITRYGSNPVELTNVNGELFFKVTSYWEVFGIWKTDGTSEGTVRLTDLSLRSPKLFTNVNGTLFFSGYVEQYGHELWKSDGTPEGTVIVKDLTPGRRNDDSWAAPHLSYLTPVDDKLYFLAVAPIPEGYTANNLWVSDGTEQGTKSLTAFLELDFTLINPFITPFNGYVYFTGQTSTGVHIYRTDGTPDGEELFFPMVGKRLSSTAQLTVADNFLYYVSKGRLWRTDGENHFAINGVGTATEGSDPVMITNADGTVYFGAFDGTSHGLWKSDGTESGTTLIHYFDEPVRDLEISGNNLYYWANRQTGFKLWTTDLTTGATTQISNINPDEHDYILELTDVNGTLFFYVERLNYDSEIWLTTGTLESTRRVKTINTVGLALTNLTNMNGTLFFAGAPNEVGPELWKSDGTEAGTVIVKRLNTNPEEPTAPDQLTVVGNTLYFIGYNGYDYELYKTDGTADGTVMVKDVRTDDEFDTDIGELTALNGMLYFSSLDVFDESTGFYTRAIWKTDGTEAGTVKVATFDGIYDLPVINGVNILSAVEGNIILVLQQDIYGTFELWKISDIGDGAEKIADLPDLQGLSSFNDNVVKDGVLYMNGHLSGNSPLRSQLWRTDGTACGTYVIIEGASTADLTLSGDKIFVSAATPEVGSELFLLHAPAGAPCEDISSSSIAARRTLESFFSEGSINTYPNPFTTDFQLKIEGTEGGAFDVTILDQYGNTRRTSSQLLFNEEHILGRDWAPGIYYMHLQHEGTLVSKKIVKRR